MTLHLIAYTSKYTRPQTNLEADLHQIATAAEQRNHGLAITGILIHLGGRFLQVIEGPQDALEILMSRIEQDSRHETLVRLIDAPVSGRGFRNWRMEVLNLDDSDINPERLVAIRDQYAKTFSMLNSIVLVEFYKAMLKRSGEGFSERKVDWGR